MAGRDVNGANRLLLPRGSISKRESRDLEPRLQKDCFETPAFSLRRLMRFEVGFDLLRGFFVW
jgi:hypothetical protein